MLRRDDQRIRVGYSQSCVHFCHIYVYGRAFQSKQMGYRPSDRRTEIHADCVPPNVSSW